MSLGQGAGRGGNAGHNSTYNNKHEYKQENIPYIDKNQSIETKKIIWIELEFDKDIRTVIKTVCRLFKKLEKSGMTNVTYRLGRHKRT